MPKQRLASMSVDALLKLKNDIGGILSRRADALRRELRALGEDYKEVGRIAVYGKKSKKARKAKIAKKAKGAKKVKAAKKARPAQKAKAAKKTKRAKKATGARSPAPVRTPESPVL
jgi:hypothetical protein